MKQIKKYMLFILLIMLFIILCVIGGTYNQTYKRKMESLTRSMIVVNTNQGILINWRSFESDKDKLFKLYKNYVIIYEGHDKTNYLDQYGTIKDNYMLEEYDNNKLIKTYYPEITFTDKNTKSSGSYIDIPLNIPENNIMPDQEEVYYTPNDIAVGDVDGDGEYEILLKWDPSNSKDNSIKGYTGNVYIDCYKINGKQLWRIDLGLNVRAGPHYTQMMVYDFDGDRKAEIVLKTSDGTIDGLGNIIGIEENEERPNQEEILEKNEYLTLFEGETGKELDTILYEPKRGDINNWGDDYGNRSERNIATVAYLNGRTPSVVMIRGYYEKIEAVSYDIINKKIRKRWTFDSTSNEKNKKATSNGNHQAIAADIDNDSKDEIILGSTVLDDDGTMIYTTSLGHGDQLHVGDFYEENEGLEIFMCHESIDIGYGITLRDGKTGKILVRKTGIEDTNRCIIDNLIGEEIQIAGSQDYKIYDNKGNYINEWYQETELDINSLIYWDGDLNREIQDGIKIGKLGNNTIFEGENVTSINGTKNNASLIADILGDWREEIIYPTKNRKSLRLYTTTYETNNKINTLMHNPLYRINIANQNVGYNQSAHLDYRLK